MCRPPAVSAYHPAASDGGPVVSHTRHPVGNCAPPPVAFPACVSTRVPQRRCLPFHAPIPPATSTDCSAASDGGQVVILRPVVRGLMAVVLPQSRFPVPSPGRFGCPAGDPTPIMQVKVRTRAKSRVSIGIATLIQGMRFHGN